MSNRRDEHPSAAVRERAEMVVVQGRRTIRLALGFIRAREATAVSGPVIDPSDWVNGHEYYREYLTETGEVLELPPDIADPLVSLSTALSGRRLRAVVPRCSCGWRGSEIDRSAVDTSSGQPARDPFAQWFLEHMVA